MLISHYFRIFPVSLTLALLLLTGLSGCSLDQADRPTKLAALARWEDQRLAPQDSLTAMLRNDDAHVRLAAARTAGLIGRSDVLPELFTLLDDQSTTVARQAAFSLGLIGDDAAVPGLERTARNPLASTRVAALRGLAHLQHSGEAFLEATDSRDPEEAVAAWNGLRNVATAVDSTALHEALLAGLRRQETDILWRVLRCCERTPWPTLIPAIAPHAKSAHPQVRVHAYRALARMNDSAALDIVVAGGRDAGKFRDRHRDRVQVALLRALGSLGHFNFEMDESGDGEVRDFLVATLITGAGQANPHLAVTALTAMENSVTDLPLPAEAALQESLLPVWRIRLARAAQSHLDHPVADIRAAAVRAWALLRGSGSGPELVEFLDQQTAPPVVAAALFAISRVHANPLETLNRYSGGAEGGSPLVRTAALEGTDHVSRERPGVWYLDLPRTFALDQFVAATADEDFVVAATGAELLGNYPDRVALRALVELWDRAGGPNQSDLQLAVLTALEAMGPAVAALEQPDTTGFYPDQLLESTRLVLRKSFDSNDLRIRYQGCTSSEATGLLPPELIPTRASLLATMPAFRRSPDQPPLTLPFSAPKVRCVTDQGTFVIQLNGEIAPNTCANILGLIKRGFYDDLIFHRVVPDFVVQGGCPRGDGWGGPGYTIRSEWSRAPFRRAAVGIAHSGKDSGGSQFFVTLSEQPHLNGRYTVFGEVTEGMEVVDRVTPGDHFRLELLP